MRRLRRRSALALVAPKPTPAAESASRALQCVREAPLRLELVCRTGAEALELQINAWIGPRGTPESHVRWVSPAPLACSNSSGYSRGGALMLAQTAALRHPHATGEAS